MLCCCAKRDHPTAEEVFIRAKREMPDISMATVYNCLDALVKCGLVRQVTLERGATRFCPNMREHCHFYCDQCESVFDIELPGGDRDCAAEEATGRNGMISPFMGDARPARTGRRDA